jgi:hypothetical protein
VPYTRLSLSDLDAPYTLGHGAVKPTDIDPEVIIIRTTKLSISGEVPLPGAGPESTSVESRMGASTDAEHRPVSHRRVGPGDFTPSRSQNRT